MNAKLIRIIAATCVVAGSYAVAQTTTTGSGTSGSSNTGNTGTSGSSNIGNNGAQSGSAGQATNPANRQPTIGVSPGAGLGTTPMPGASATVPPRPGNDPLGPNYVPPGASSSVSPAASLSPSPTVHP